MVPAPDRSLDTLLELDGDVFVIDRDGGYWVKFSVRRVPVTPDKPHGLDYSLTLHGPTGERLVGFDNAHVDERRKDRRTRRGAANHRHRLKTVQPYEYQDAATLLADFWREVDAVLKHLGVVP